MARVFNKLSVCVLLAFSRMATFSACCVSIACSNTSCALRCTCANSQKATSTHAHTKKIKSKTKNKHCHGPLFNGFYRDNQYSNAGHLITAEFSQKRIHPIPFHTVCGRIALRLAYGVDLRFVSPLPKITVAWSLQYYSIEWKIWIYKSKIPPVISTKSRYRYNPS